MQYQWIVFNDKEESTMKKIDDLMSVKLYHGIGKVSVIFRGDEKEYFLTLHETLDDIPDDNFIYEWIMDYCTNSNNMRPRFFSGGYDQDDSVGSGVIRIPEELSELSAQELLQELFPAY